MSLFSQKKVVALLLASFLMVALFGLTAMVHTSDSDMSLDCPLSAVGVVLCPTDLSAAAMHHLSSYYSIFNVPIGFSAALVSLLLLLVSLIFLILHIDLSFWIPRSYVSRLASNFATPTDNKQVSRWLSLLENSPSSY